MLCVLFSFSMFNCSSTVVNENIKEMERTNEQLDKLKKETLGLIKNIESEKDFPPNKSVLCHWCEYKTTRP